ncbi:unnamed protein product [Staurois parvus]|uniref:Uncharacterized protein n=1 Tax=Staurois parvus TaxID=386267 RepID=A0ABN9E629_9NEOB|nr:unnamed protein product [Staurois parvus]
MYCRRVSPTGPSMYSTRDPVPAVSSGHSGTPIVVRDLCARS